MRLISFFSFKGGVGRSSALLNTAYLLAKRRWFVVLVDMDIHAPGLSLLADLAPLEADRPRIGLLDFLDDALHAERPTLPDLAELAYRPRLLADIGTDFRGDLFFVPCGFFDGLPEERAYRRRLRRLPVDALRELWRRGDAGALLDVIKEHLSALRSDRLGDRAPDFVFLDARTGFTEIGDMVISRASDHVVALLGLNEQNRRGLEFLLAELREAEDFPINSLPSRLSVVVTPVPDGEERLKSEVLGLLREAMAAQARRDDSIGAPEAMPELLEVPYHPHIALSERVIVREHPDSRPAMAYRRLAEHLERQVIDTRSLQLRQAADTKAQLGELLVAVVRQEEEAASAQTNPAHPYSRAIPWNLLVPVPDWRTLLGTSTGLADEQARGLLNLLAGSASLTDEEKERVIDNACRFGGEQFLEPLRVLTEERDRLLEAPARHWSRFAWTYGENLARWQLLLVRRGLLSGIDEAYERLERHEVRGQIGPIGRFAAFWRGWAEAHYGRGEFSCARRVLETGCGALAQEGRLRTFLAQLLRLCNRLEGAESAIAEARRLLEVHGDREGLADALKEMAHLLLRTGRLEEAEAAYREALRLHTEMDDKLGMAYDCKGLADLLLRTDRLAEAEATYRKALRLHRAVDSRLGTANDYLGLADLLLRTGRLAEAEATYREALRLHRAVDDRLGVANDHRGLADLLLRTDRLLEAEAAWREALRLHTAVDFKLGMANDRRVEGELLTKRQDWEGAKVALDEAERLLDQLKDREGVAEVLLARARWYRARGREAEATGCYRDAEQRARGVGLTTLARAVAQEAARI